METVVEARMSQRCRGEGVVFADTNGLRVHLIGIGGSGMMGAAALLRDMGSRVSGSDLTGFAGLGVLVRSGVRVSIGHCQSQVDADVELVVASAAVPESNPELALARRRGIPVINYAELLGALMAVREGVAIAGTHGKSTTTAMTAHLFREAGLSPSFVIGARSGQLGGSSGLGQGPHFIVEACEFNRSFLHFRPRLAAVLNVEPDHLDCYRDLDEIVAAFTDFCGHVDPRGLVVLNGDDPRAVRAAAKSRCEVQTFGFSESADWSARELKSDRGRFLFDVWFRGSWVLNGRLSIPGRHNVANALPAIALAYRAGGDPAAVAAALPTFAGVDRRLTWRGEGHGVTILDDYAHHPTEIRVTIEAARSRYQPKRTWIVFQPHQTSRTRYFMNEFAESFRLADEVIVLNVYCARENDETAGRSGAEELVARIRHHGGHARYLATFAAVADHLAANLTEGDLVMTMGAGDIWKVTDELVERLCQPDGMRRTPRSEHVVPPGGVCPVSVSAA